MSKVLKNFSINDVQMYRETEENVDFSVVEIWALADGNNSHRNPFSNEVLRKDADTFKGKLIIAKFNEHKQDAEAHEIDEQIVGYVDPSSEVEFKTKEVDGIVKEFAVVKGLISKIYAKNIVDMFRTFNERTVSCEFSCATKYEEDNTGHARDEYGRVIDNPILSYHIHGITILGLDYNPSVRGTEIKVKQFMEKHKELSQSEYIANELKKLAERILNQTSDDDDYILNIQGDIMEENKKLSESTEDKEEKDIVMEEKECTEETKECAEETKCAEEETKECSECGAESEEKDFEAEPKSEEEPESEEDKEEEKEMAEADKEEESEKVEEDKKFSFAEFVTIDMSEENEEIKTFVEKTFSMEANEIVTTLITMAKENMELKKFQAEKLKEEMEKKVNTFMASFEGIFDEKTFSEFKDEGIKISDEEFGSFANKVKAFAYEATKNNIKSDENDLMRMAGRQEQKQMSELTADDIYRKYL